MRTDLLSLWPPGRDSGCRKVWLSARIVGSGSSTSRRIRNLSQGCQNMGYVYNFVQLTGACASTDAGVVSTEEKGNTLSLRLDRPDYTPYHPGHANARGIYITGIIRPPP